MNHRLIWVALLCLVLGSGGCGDDPPGGHSGTDAGMDEGGGECLEGELSCDGECVSVVDDPLHCGSCDPCPMADGATAFCVASTCELACAEGFGDADGDLGDPEGNGCECARSGAEVCDGVDNDCDGAVDGDDGDLDLTACAELAGAVATGCAGEGCVYACADGFRDGNDDVDQGLEGNGCECTEERTPEVCDGVDNDCNGQTDEAGEDLLSACAPLANAAVTGCEAGACTYRCDDGFGDANGDLGDEGSDGCECTVREEICDGVDNDCDGLIDADDDDFRAQLACPMVDGAVAGCDERCIWSCADGRADVDADLGRGPDGNGCECTTSGDEVCDGEDNDCDGLVDSDDDDLQLMACPNQDGVCQGASELCVDGEHVECDDQRYADHADEQGWQFDGIGGIELGCDDASDNNCNGVVDENCCDGDEGIVTLLGPENDDNRQIVPSIAVNGSGDRILVAWQETVDTEDEEASFQGTVRWAVFGLSGNHLGSHTVPVGEGAAVVQPAATWDGTTFVVAYVIHGDQSRFIRVTRVDEEGSTRDGNIVFNDANGTITDVSISGRGDGSNVVAWTFMRRVPLTPVCQWEDAESCIQFAVVDRQNQVTPFQEISPAEGTPLVQRPDAVFGEAEGVIVWQRLDVDPGRIVVGSITDGTLGTRNELPQMSHRPPVTFAGASPSVVRAGGGYLVAHEDFVGDTIQIVIRQLDANGAPVGQPTVATEGDNDKRSPRLVSTAEGVALVWATANGVGFRSLATNGSPLAPADSWFGGRQLGYRPVAGTALARAAAWVDASEEGVSPERLHFRITTVSGELRCAAE